MWVFQIEGNWIIGIGIGICQFVSTLTFLFVMPDSLTSRSRFGV